tara:strand:- start:1291 stop:1596 length:306 start_codon:yes stop_codon:yes gene_type:complete
MTNYVPTSIINVSLKDSASIPAKPGTLRFKRLQVMQQCSGQTVADFYAKCRKEVPGTVSKKLLAVAINKGFATVITEKGKDALSQTDLTRYDRKKPVAKKK